MRTRYHQTDVNNSIDSSIIVEETRIPTSTSITPKLNIKLPKRYLDDDELKYM